MIQHQEGHKWPEAHRADVVASYLILGNAAMVEAVTGVPAGTVRQWKTQPWWDDLVDQIKSEDDQELDSKLTKRINKVLEVVEDRLEKGEFVYDAETKSFVRKPVSLRDSWKAGKEMIDVRMMLRNQPKSRADQGAVADILKNLAEDFAKMAKKKVRVQLEEKINAEERESVQSTETASTTVLNHPLGAASTFPGGGFPVG